MTRIALYKFSIIAGLCFVLVGFSSQVSIAQTKTQSTFNLGPLKPQKNAIPDEGSLKGSVVVLNSKKKVPLAFIDVVGTRSIQCDQKGKFNLVLAQGTYKIKITCSGYKDLTIENIAIQEGSDQYITIQMALKDKGDFK